jgi:hypothetical protein
VRRLTVGTLASWHRAAQKGDVPSTEEYGCVIDASRDSGETCQYTNDRDDRCDELLKSREDDRFPNLDSAAIPIDLMVTIDPKSVQILDADWLNTRGPSRRGRVGQDLWAFSTTERRLSISAIASASLVNTCACLPTVSCNSSMVVRARMSRSPTGVFATGQETRLSKRSASTERALPLRSMRRSISSTFRSSVRSIGSPILRATDPASAFLGCPKIRPGIEADCFLPASTFGFFSLIDINRFSPRQFYMANRQQIHMGFATAIQANWTLPGVALAQIAKKLDFAGRRPLSLRLLDFTGGWNWTLPGIPTPAIA